MKSASFSLLADFAACVAFLAQLHRERNLQAWVATMGLTGKVPQMNDRCCGGSRIKQATRVRKLPSHLRQNPLRSNHACAPGQRRSASSSRPQQAKNWPGLVRSTGTLMSGSLSFMLRIPRARPNVDCGPKSHDNSCMEVSGRVQNGVVVLDGSASLPEGAAVTVTLRTSPVIRVAKNQKQVEFPLVPSSAPGSIGLTNEMIGDILDEEDASS